MANIRRSIFFAFPWDTLTKNFYEDVFNKFKQDWDIYCGPQKITTPPTIGEVRKFRNQNQILFNLFVENIQASNVFIADVTNSNPNVMLELGIAIKLNKNILILSGTSTDRLPFDISGFEVVFYKTKEQLVEKIDKYLKFYLSVKNMDFNSPVGSEYYKLENYLLEASEEAITRGDDHNAFRITPLLIEGLPKMRDLKLKIQYRILAGHTNNDWFGLMLRSAENKGGYEPIFFGSLLINSRINGNTDLTLYPGQRVIKTFKTNNAPPEKEFRSLELMLDNEFIGIKSELGNFEYKSLQLTNFGFIYLACYKTKVEIKKIEILHIDTITEI